MFQLTCVKKMFRYSQRFLIANRRRKNSLTRFFIPNDKKKLLPESLGSSYRMKERETSRKWFRLTAAATGDTICIPMIPGPRHTVRSWGWSIEFIKLMRQSKPGAVITARLRWTSSKTGDEGKRGSVQREGRHPFCRPWTPRTRQDCNRADGWRHKWDT